MLTLALKFLLSSYMGVLAFPIADESLRNMRVTLCGAETPTLVLSYSGPIIEYNGSLCYGFAGYNETCFQPDFGWLTPATRIELIAPGQVPIELLRGYTLLVRYPRLSQAQYRYPIDSDDHRCNRYNHGQAGGFGITIRAPAD